MSLDPASITLAEAAQAMLETPSDSVRFQIFFEFMRGADDADLSALPLIESEPQRNHCPL